MLATQLYNYKLLSVGLASNKALEVPHEMTEHTRSKQLPSALCPAKLQRRNGIQWIALRLLLELNWEAIWWSRRTAVQPHLKEPFQQGQQSRYWKQVITMHQLKGLASSYSMFFLCTLDPSTHVAIYKHLTKRPIKPSVAASALKCCQNQISVPVACGWFWCSGFHYPNAASHFVEALPASDLAGMSCNWPHFTPCDPFERLQPNSFSASWANDVKKQWGKKDMVLHKTCSNLQSRYLGQSRCCDCNIPDFLACPAEYGNMVINCRKDRIEAKQSAPAQCHEQALASSSHVMMFWCVLKWASCADWMCPGPSDSIS